MAGIFAANILPNISGNMKASSLKVKRVMYQHEKSVSKIVLDFFFQSLLFLT